MRAASSIIVVLLLAALLFALQVRALSLEEIQCGIKCSAYWRCFLNGKLDCPMPRGCDCETFAS